MRKLMNFSQGRIFEFSLVGLFFVMLPSPAYAYIDPGASSLLLQFLLAGGVAVMLTLKSVWARLKGSSKTNPPDRMQTEEDDSKLQ